MVELIIDSTMKNVALLRSALAKTAQVPEYDQDQLFVAIEKLVKVDNRAGLEQVRVNEVIQTYSVPLVFSSLTSVDACMFS